MRVDPAAQRNPFRALDVERMEDRGVRGAIILSPYQRLDHRSRLNFVIIAVYDVRFAAHVRMG
jgi:hypothetical protein